MSGRKNAGRQGGPSGNGSGAAERFDADYYRRFYGDPATAVSDPDRVHRLCAFVLAYLDFLDLPVASVLDLGCGVGHWRAALLQLRPGCRYLGVESSAFLCGEHGWTRGSAVDFAPGRSFDLVVCQGVLQYLDDRRAARAIANLGRLSRGALYVEALTSGDWRHNCDRRLTDGDVHLRPAAWYRPRLRRSFHAIGGGLQIRRGAPVTLFDLETLA